MYCIRIKFTRGNEVKFISHLDLMRVFERALRRADIPVAYSGGFNPRMKMVFGLPLGVGVTSQAEFADIDIDVNEKIGTEDFKRRLNAQLPKGITILEAAIKKNTQNIMASITAARYEITVSLKNSVKADVIGRMINDFMHQEKILVEKKTKKRNTMMDIKPLIIELDLFIKSENNFKKINIGDNSIENYSFDNSIDVFRLDVLVSAGNKENLKPDLLVKALSEWSEAELKVLAINRLDLYVTDNKGKFVSPIF